MNKNERRKNIFKNKIFCIDVLNLRKWQLGTIKSEGVFNKFCGTRRDFKLESFYVI